MKNLSLSALVICLLSLGCGSGTSVLRTFQHGIISSDSTCDTTAPATQSNASYSVQPASTEISLYPGQTSQLSVALTSLDSSQHRVTVSAGHLPLGLRVTPVTGTTGHTVKLVLQASQTLASNCFTTQNYIYTLTIPVVITGTSSAGTTTEVVNLTVVLENPNYLPTKVDLPVMTLTTDGAAAIVNTDDYLSGTVQVSDSSNASNSLDTQTMSIKGHGNTTWTMPKKPYNLKFDSKTSLLGMAKAKKWILLANYDDKTMLRNYLAFYISKQTSLAWTPNSAFVELYLNGQYEGVYQVSEKVEIDSNRLNIDELDDDDNSGTALTGGYLLEFDSYRDATYVFDTPQGLPVDSDDPDPPTTEQANYITNVVDTAENALFGSNYTDEKTGWPAYFDKTSFIDWYIVEELMGNQDGDFFSSAYFFKQRNNPLLYMGPIWDMDVTAGNVINEAIMYPNQMYVRNTALWYERFFQDPAFLAAVKVRWTELRPQFNNIPTFVDESASSLKQGEQNNFQRWPILHHIVLPNQEAAGTYQGEVDVLKSWMAARLVFMDENYLLQ